MTMYIVGALRSFLHLDVTTHLIDGPGVRGSRWCSLGSALRSFLHFLVRAYLTAGQDVQGGRWWSFGSSHDSCHWPLCFRCVPTLNNKKLRSAPPGGHHHLSQHLDYLLDASWHLNAKNHGAHYLDSIIGYPKHLEHLFDASWLQNAKNYGAQYVDSIIGYLDHLDHAWNALWHIDAKHYGVYPLDSVNYWKALKFFINF